jgi:hypothetical protein
MTRHLTTASFIILSLFAGASRAEPLEIQRWKADREKDLKLAVDSANKWCGTSITSRFDWSAFNYDDYVHKFGAPNVQLAPNAVEHACRTGDDAKAAVKKAITTIVIKPGPGADSRLELKDGELDMYPVLDHNMNIETARAWLLKHL